MKVMSTIRTLLVLAALVLLPAIGVAQQPSQDGFVPVDQLDAVEQIPAAPLVAAAYAIAWAAVLVYVFSVWRRLQKVEQELAEVGRRIEPGARQ